MEINMDREMSASPSKLIAEAELQAIEQSRPRRTNSRSSSVSSRRSSVRSRPDSALALVLERQMEMQREQTECQTQLLKRLVDGQLDISRRIDNIESSPRGSPILRNNVSGSS